MSWWINSLAALCLFQVFNLATYLSMRWQNKCSITLGCLHTLHSFKVFIFEFDNLLSFECPREFNWLRCCERIFFILKFSTWFFNSLWLLPTARWHGCIGLQPCNLCCYWKLSPMSLDTFCHWSESSDMFFHETVTGESNWNKVWNLELQGRLKVYKINIFV